LRQQVAVTFAGLLPFTTPLRKAGDIDAYAATFEDAQWSGAHSTRLELFMPHGLDEATTAEGIAGRIQLVDHGIAFPVLAGANATATPPQALPLKASIISPCAP
jgi:hypothetical protein